MNTKLKKIFTNPRVILVLIVLLFAIISIHPNPTADGVAIRNVIPNSSASIAGIESPGPNVRPMSRERILSMNNRPIKDMDDYNEFILGLKPNRTVTIKTTKKVYRLFTEEKYNVTVIGTEKKTIVEEVFDNETNTTENITKVVEVPKIKKDVIGMEDIGLRVYDAPKTNIKKGLDLQGGTRVLLQPETKQDDEDMDMLIENMKQRLNVYGLSDIVVKESGDLSGNQYVLVEIAGANEQEVKELLAKQGKFEAKVGNETVFIGGKRDITYVGRGADEAGIDPNVGCGTFEGGWTCRFRFVIALSPEAAQRQADATKDLNVITGEGDSYLEEKLMLYLDDKLVDELNIGADLKGRAVTDIQISGSGVGRTQQEAVFDSLENMKRLQTILITGSLPVKLDIVKTDNISPVLGQEFVRSAILVALLAISAVGIIVFIRYRKLQVAVPMIITSFIEVIVLVGIAAIIGWNLDLAAIAGIIIAVGTGVDHQIVITDETLRGEVSQIFDWKKRIKSAFFIIMAAYLTTIVAMIPLLSAGAGLLRGFALTTMIGISIGVFISRPAYANVIEILLKE